MQECVKIEISQVSCLDWLICIDFCMHRERFCTSIQTTTLIRRCRQCRKVLAVKCQSSSSFRVLGRPAPTELSLWIPVTFDHRAHCMPDISTCKSSFLERCVTTKDSSSAEPQRTAGSLNRSDELRPFFWFHALLLFNENESRTIQF